MKSKVVRMLSVLILSLALTGCQLPPERYVDSYEEIQEALKDHRDIAFPDISLYEERYRQNDFIYKVKLYQADRRVRNDYAVIFGHVPTAAELESGQMTPLEFILSAINLEKYEDDRNTPEPLDLNLEHQGVAMWEYYNDVTYLHLSSDSNIERWNAEDPDFPTEQFRAVTQGYEFDLDGYRYQVNAQINFLFDEAEGLTLEEKMAPFKEELLDIVDSILDERGVGR